MLGRCLIERDNSPVSDYTHTRVQKHSALSWSALSSFSLLENPTLFILKPIPVSHSHRLTQRSEQLGSLHIFNFLFN